MLCHSRFTWVKGRREGRGNEAGKLVRSHSCRLYLTIVCSTRRLIHSKLDDDTEREKPKDFRTRQTSVVAKNIFSQSIVRWRTRASADETEDDQINFSAFCSAFLWELYADIHNNFHARIKNINTTVDCSTFKIRQS